MVRAFRQERVFWHKNCTLYLIDIPADYPNMRANPPGIETTHELI